MVARRWYWPVVTAASLGAYTLAGDRLRDEHRVSVGVELLTPDRSTRNGSNPNPFDTDALAGVVGQRLRTPEQLALYRAAGLSVDTHIGLDSGLDTLVITADHADEAVAAATVDRLVEDARTSLASVQLAMGVGDDRTVAMGAAEAAPTEEVMSERRMTQLGVAAGVLWLTTAITAAITRHLWSKRRKAQRRARAEVTAAGPPAQPTAPEAAPTVPAPDERRAARRAPASPPPRPNQDPRPPEPAPGGRPGPALAPGPDGRLPMQPVPRSTMRERSAPARGPVRAAPTASAMLPPERALPSAPRTIDGGYRPTASRLGAAEGADLDDDADAIDLRDPPDPLDDSPPVHPGRRGVAPPDEPLTRFSGAATWPGQQSAARAAEARADSLFGGAGERAAVPSVGANAAADAASATTDPEASGV